MFSARLEDALEHATSRVRRLIAVLSELESYEAQHYISTVLPEDPDSDDLLWPVMAATAQTEPL